MTCHLLQPCGRHGHAGGGGRIPEALISTVQRCVRPCAWPCDTPLGSHHRNVAGSRGPPLDHPSSRHRKPVPHPPFTLPPPRGTPPSRSLPPCDPLPGAPPRARPPPPSRLAGLQRAPPRHRHRVDRSPIEHRGPCPPHQKARGDPPPHQKGPPHQEGTPSEGPPSGTPPPEGPPPRRRRRAAATVSWPSRLLGRLVGTY